MADVRLEVSRVKLQGPVGTTAADKRLFVSNIALNGVRDKRILISNIKLDRIAGDQRLFVSRIALVGASSPARPVYYPIAGQWVAMSVYLPIGGQWVKVA